MATLTTINYACLCVLLVTINSARAIEDRCTGHCPCELGATCHFAANASSTVYVVYQLNETTENEAIRVLVSSRGAERDHPLLVTVRQPREITSWALPYVESGHVYHTVERTLCPLNNRDDDPVTARLLIDVSTSSLDTINFTLSTSIVDNFQLKLDEPATITASPSKPAYLQFSYPPSTTKVKVRFSSQDNTSHVCAIASIQTTYCPVVELLDNPDHRGTFQTMRSTAAINTRLTGPLSNSSGGRPGSYGFFYAVVTVFPSNEDHSSCYSSGRSANDHLVTSSISGNSDGLSNSFDDPMLVLEEDEREKTITITVVPALSDAGYAVAIVTATIVYMVFYFIALIWIFFSDYICYQENSMIQFITRELTKQRDRVGAYEPSEDGEGGEGGDGVMGEDQIDSGGTGHGEKAETHIHNNHDRYGSPEPLTPDPEEEPDGKGLSLRKVLPRQRYSSKMSTVSELPEDHLKRPSFLNVLVGSHLSVALNEVAQLQNSAHPSPVLHRRPHPQQVVRHHTSRSESHATYSSPESSFNATQSLTTAAVRSVQIDPFESSLMKTKSLDNHQALGHGYTDYVEEEAPSNETLNEEEHGYHGDEDLGRGGGGGHVTWRKRSYEKAIDSDGNFVDQETAVGESDHEGGVARCRYRCDTECLPVNLYLSEVDVENVDEGSVAQKDYNHLYWYMITIIIFYGIPAFQLVITYQQLLNVSGNEDLCYYNSLCSHPWRVSSSLTLSSLNNIISNIGYFVLGFLFILIAYRRRTVYRAFEEVNRELSREKRMGVPQYFGIYYAIGLALIAEAFMSAAYHICPSNANYQYDTTFMFVLGGLGLFKLLESRSPDHNPPLYKVLFLQAAIIVLAVVGVLYSTTLLFYILFFIVHMTTTFFVTVEIYYRWQISVRKSMVDVFKLLTNCVAKKRRSTRDIESRGEEGERERERGGNFPLDQAEGELPSLPHHSKQYSVVDLFKMYKSEGLCPPKHKPKLVMAILSNVVNLGFALYMVGLRPLDFGTNFLTILITNFLLYLIFYAITKSVYKECNCKDVRSFRPIGFFFLSVIFWMLGVYSYRLAATDWLQPPAISRDGNRDCLILDFFDSHDLWHFTSAFGLFFSFVMLMTLDDNQDGTTRNKLRVF